MKIQAIIFDMDGVLFDSERAYKDIFPKVAKNYGYDIEAKIIEKTLGLTYEATELFYKNIYGDDMPFSKIGEDLENELIKMAYNKTLKMKKNVLKFLDYLNKLNLPLAIASSNTTTCINGFIDAYNIKNYFKYIISGDEVENGKPHPEIFLKAAKALNVDAKNCLVIEDSINGLKAARKAGMISVMVPDLIPYSQVDVNLVDYVFNDIIDIKKLIEENI